MKRIYLSMTIAFLCLSCRSSNVDIPPGATVEYEDEQLGVRVKVSGHLAETILARLADDPDYASDVRVGAESPTKLYIAGKTFLLRSEGEITLVDTWGTRAWFVTNLIGDLDAYLRKEVAQGRGTPSPGGPLFGPSQKPPSSRPTPSGA